MKALMNDVLGIGQYVQPRSRHNRVSADPIFEAPDTDIENSVSTWEQRYCVAMDLMDTA